MSIFSFSFLYFPVLRLQYFSLLQQLTIKKIKPNHDFLYVYFNSFKTPIHQWFAAIAFFFTYSCQLALYVVDVAAAAALAPSLFYVWIIFSEDIYLRLICQ